MLRKSKKFSLPRKPYDKPRILDENKLVEKYGLKNKKEIWKTDSKVKYFRKRARSLITAEQNEQEKFFGNLNKIGLNVKTIADVLALDVEDLLKRRLSSFLVRKKMALTTKNARQMIVHKKIMIRGKVVNIPSYVVKVDDEDLISIRKVVQKPKTIEEPKKETEIQENIKEESEDDTPTKDVIEEAKT